MKAAVKVYRDGREVCQKSAAGTRIYRMRVEEMWLRQNGRCSLCLLPMRLELATFDHEGGRGFSGSKRDDRIEVDGKWQNAAACFDCNARKASRRIPYLIQQPVEFTKHFEELLGE